MTAKILDLVHGCNTCPNRRYYSGGTYECNKARHIIPAAGTMSDEGRPDWCPLTDYIRHVSVAKISLADLAVRMKFGFEYLMEKVKPLLGKHVPLSAPVNVLEILTLAFNEIDSLQGCIKTMQATAKERKVNEQPATAPTLNATEQPSWVTRAASVSRDWHEDWDKENGQYQNLCCSCHHVFLGYKRRVTCQRCDSTRRLWKDAAWAAINKYTLAYESKDNEKRDEAQREMEAFLFTSGPALGNPLKPNPGEVVIDYTNWKGERALRRIQPLDLFYGQNKWHTTPQWLLKARDVEKGEERMFAVPSIHAWHGPLRNLVPAVLLGIEGKNDE